MFRILCTIVCLCFVLPSMGRAASEPDGPIEVKVIKRKKGKAMIKHSKKFKLKKKKVYILSPKDAPPPAQDEEGEDADEVSRRKFIGVDIDLGMFSRDSGTNQPGLEEDVKSFDIQALFGWNFGRLEFGAFVEHEFYTIGDNDTSTLLGGGFVDFNLHRNTVDRSFILGVRGIVGAGTQDRSSFASAAGLTRFGGSVFVKYFGFSESTAIILQGGYLIDNAAFEEFDVQTSGTSVKLGVQLYF